MDVGGDNNNVGKLGETVTDKKTKENRWIPFISIAIALGALFLSYGANKISRHISDITNRPYILINDIAANRGSKGTTDAEAFLPVEYQFTFSNNGTLPAWVTQYEIYVNGTNGPIHLIFNPIVKPVKNFTIGKNANETRGYRSVLRQRTNEENGPVDTFEASKHKMLLIVVTYKTMGDANGKNIFTTWQLAKFGMRQNIECGTNSMTNVERKELFKKQEKIFELNEAK